MTLDPRVGLCSACAHARRVVTAREPTFWLCERALTDPAYCRYPPLPVAACPGFDPPRNPVPLDRPPPDPSAIHSR